MTIRRARHWALVAAVALAVGLVLSAQVQSVGAAHSGLSGHLHTGTCDDLSAEPAAELETLGHTDPILGTPVGTPPSRVSTVGAQGAVPAVTSSTVVDIPLDRLLAEAHAIEISLTSEQQEEPISLACGNVGGVPAGGDLAFGLRPRAAGTSGVAWLHAVDGRTRITLFVTQGLTETGTPTP